MKTDVKDFPFKGIVWWRVGEINFHAYRVFIEMAKKGIEVIFCIREKRFRDQGDMDTGDCKVVFIKSMDDFPREILNKDYLHIVGSIKHIRNHNDLLYACEKELIRHKCPMIALNIEQYPWWGGWKGILRRLQWFYIYNFGDMKDIKALGCTGTTGMEAYRKCYVSKKRLFEYIYAPPRITEVVPPSKCDMQKDKFQFTFVGGINERKCVLPVVRALREMNADFQMNICGKGNLEKQLADCIKGDTRFIYYGGLQLKEVHYLLEYSDVLVLPSNFDGWGAVVNEALLHGCRCLVSSNCGSHSLIDYSKFGATFTSGDWKDFKVKAEEELKKGKVDEKMREKIKTWSKKIEPSTVCDYLVQMINYYFNDKWKDYAKPKAPWRE